MTTFLTITTPGKQGTDTTPSLPQLLFPRQTTSSDPQTSTDSQTQATSDTSTTSTASTTSASSTSSGTEQSTTTTAPILRTIDGVVYFRTSMPALDVIGVPVTTLIQGDPARPIAIWNATQAHGYEVSGIVGQWAALGVLAGFGLLFLVLFLAESIGFLRRKIHGSDDDDDEFIDKKAINTHDNDSTIPLTDSAIPLTTRRPSANMATAPSDRRSRRISTYTPLPLASLPDPEPYDAGGFEAREAGPRYYSPNQPGVGSGEDHGLPEVVR